MLRYLLVAFLGLVTGLIIGVRLAQFPDDVRMETTFAPETPSPHLSGLRKAPKEEHSEEIEIVSEFELALRDLQTVPLFEGSKFAGYKVLWLRGGSVWSETFGLEVGDIIEAEPGQPLHKSSGIVTLWGQRASLE